MAILKDNHIPFHEKIVVFFKGFFKNNEEQTPKNKGMGIGEAIPFNSHELTRQFHRDVVCQLG